MLEELTITNFALIEKLHLVFRPGFTVLTGETGAGKSILAGALGLLAGNKASVDSIRTGADEAEVSGTFAVPKVGGVIDWLDQRGLEVDEGQLIVRRVLRVNGKGSVYVQGSPITVKELLELSPNLFDMHGQHEHQNLFEPSFHRKYLDGFGGLQGEVAELTAKFLLLSNLKKKRDTLLAGAADLKREKELLSFVLAEISEAKIILNEDQDLENEKTKLESIEELRVLSEEAYGFLNDEDQGVLRILSRVRSRLLGGKHIDNELEVLADRFDGLYFELEDAAGALGHYKESVLFDPDRLEEVHDRLDLLYKLKKKYGPGLDDVVAYGIEAEKRLREFGEEQEDTQALSLRIKELEKEVVNLAAILTKNRKDAASKMENKVMEVLSGLKMGKNTFVVQVTPKFSDGGVPLCGPMGADEVEYMLSANPGEPLKPLKSVASGGEISRVMLSIKSVLSEVEEAETLVFDEIDAGIGGEVGAALGTYLQRAAEKRQLLSITHLASIAVQADNHIKIEKVEEGGRTFTRAYEISGGQRVQEIARMLSGHPGQESSMAHALDLLQTYHKSF